MKVSSGVVCASDCYGLAMAGGYWRPHQLRGPYQTGSAQALRVSETLLNPKNL